MGATTNLVEIAERIRPHALTPYIACTCASPAGKDQAWMWVFREDARKHLVQLWGAEVGRAEADELVDLLSRQGSVWHGAIDGRHAPPCRWFRLAWTLPPAPCRIYRRRRLAVEVEPAVVTMRGFRRHRRIDVPPATRVEGWIGRDWSSAGITLKHGDREETEIFRLKHAGSVTQFLVMYDGIDLMVDTWWLDGLVPRVAGVLGVEWRIVDYTITPPRIERHGKP